MSAENLMCGCLFCRSLRGEEISPQKSREEIEEERRKLDEKFAETLDWARKKHPEIIKKYGL
jgi:hypothetical protein